MGYLSSSSQCSFPDPAQTWLVAAIALGFSPDLRDKTMDADPAHLGPETWRNQAGPDLEFSSPLSSFNSNERFNACNQGRKVIHRPPLQPNPARLTWRYLLLGAFMAGMLQE